MFFLVWGIVEQKTITWQTAKGNNSVTPKQHKALMFIRDYTQTHGYAPTIAEIGAHIESKPQNARVMVQALSNRGLVTRDRGWRSIKVLDAA